MRIGLDGSCLSNRRGFGRFARLLLGALSRQPTGHRFVVFVDRPSLPSVDIPDSFDRVVVDQRSAPSQAAAAQGRRRWRDMLAMGRAVARSQIDLMYFPATYSFFPVWKVGKLVVTMHDTLAFTHPELVFPRLSGRVAWWLKESAAVQWADRIVTVSRASQRAVKSWSGWPDHKICLIGEGPDPIFQPRASAPEAAAVLNRLGIPVDARYLLYVGGLSPHKNLLRLIEAFARSTPAGVKLVLAGDMHDVFHTHVPEIRAAIAQYRLTDRVIMAGFVPDDDLVFLYSRAYALVQPSLLEGFGLPAVEAMSCGIPVISSRAGALPEVVGEAGVYFDPTDVDSMAGAIGSLLSDDSQREALARLAPQRAALFSWDHSARTLLACFDELENEASRQRVTARTA
jgi:glycosyltransferase involved in cell wall biosynthesis